MRLNLKEKYLIVLVTLCFITLAFYYSYAIFVTKQLQENVVVVKTHNNRLALTIENNDNKISRNSSKDLKLSLSNTHNNDYYYLVLVKGLTAGVKVSSNDNVKGLIKALSKEEIIVHVNNTTNDDIELEFMVKVSVDDNISKELGYYYINEVDNFDHSMANKPELNNLKLIPVNYKKTSNQDGYWYKSDGTNQTQLWYSYENGIWANAVLMSNDNYNKYKDKSVGTKIEMNEILGFYVWIPRFKYNIINSTSYTNYERITNVIFEKGNDSTGTIECIDKISNLEDAHIYSEVCKDNYYNRIYDNLSTYTHPSFKDSNGFWVSKFLVSEGEKIIPNNTIMKKNINEANSISSKYHKSHVLTNMEYGAIILLSNSAYGKTGNKMYSNDDNYTFTRIYANTNEYEVTGCSSEYNIHTSNIVTETTKTCISYNDLTDYSHVSNSIKYPIGYAGAGASSTGNISGVYDLASISGEIVSAFVADNNGNSPVTTNYYDLYSYNEYVGKVSSSSNIYNLYRYKLGDGIRENYRSFNESGMWHSGSLMQNKESGILVRGGNVSAYSVSVEDTSYIAPFRLVLVP